MPHKGFTLIELVVTIAILSILLTIAIPSFSALIINNRISTQTNDFISDLAYARAEAVRRNTRISICESATGTSCGVGAGATWDTGWMIWIDLNNDGIVNPGEPILRVHGALSAGTTFVATGLTGGGVLLQYLPSGIVEGVAGSTAAFTLGQPGYFGRTINFNTTGRVNTAKTAAILP